MAQSCLPPSPPGSSYCVPVTLPRRHREGGSYGRLMRALAPNLHVGACKLRGVTSWSLFWHL